MNRFHSRRGLLDAVADRNFERPPAIVCNAHVTGLGVARALSAHDVPVIALDRVEDGVAPGSNAVDLAGHVTYPLDDLDGFREDVEAVADETGHEPVAFGCMDEWVHAFADAEPEGVRLPFADREVIDGVLDKTALYARCEKLGVPYPETYRIEETGTDGNGPPARSTEAAAEELGFPLVLKPALKREFEEAVGTNVIEVESREEYREVVSGAADEGIRLMAQEKVPVAEGEDRSLASYVPPEGDPLAVVGNARVRFPGGYGTSCVVDAIEDPALRDRALSVLDDAGYYGISESEFVYDEAREEYVLLDVNTRPWKWIGMPVATGRNLPMAAYTDATGGEYEPNPTDEMRWVFLADYIQRLSTDPGFVDVLSQDEWMAILAGEMGPDAGIVTGVYDPDDPKPACQLVRTELGGREYYCAC